MRGREFASDGVLSERDLQELADLLAMRIYQRLAQRAYALSRQDVAELIHPYISDLLHNDQRTITWMVWDLLQEGAEIEFSSH